MSNSISVQLALRNLEQEYTRFTKLLTEIPDEQWLAEVAPNKNTGIYLLGHLIAASDGIRTLLGLGDKLYPEMAKPFIGTPDKSGQEMPPVAELKTRWQKVVETTLTDIKTLSDAEWFGKHTSVSEEDFAKEPHRNKLSIIFTRTNHQAYHAGQIVLLKK